MEHVNGYIALYRGKKLEVYADTSYHAQIKAAEVWRIPDKKRHEITVMLAEIDGTPVTQSTQL